MPNRLKPFNLFDFTGGVNLRPETFQLRENEMPELLNMEIDPRGGLNTRRAWIGLDPPVTGTYHMGYLTPTLGVATTSDTADLQITGDRVITAKLRFTDVDKIANTTIACIKNAAASTNAGWWFYNASGTVVFLVSFSGSAWTFAGNLGKLPINLDNTWILLQAILDLDNGAGGHTISGRYSIDDGVTWTWLPSVMTASGTGPGFNSTAPVSIGAENNGTFPFQGDITWCEMRTGTDWQAGTVVFRFDVGDYTSGTSFTDPRGRTWTVSNASAMTPEIVPPMWNPRLAYAHTNSLGTRMWLVANKHLPAAGQVYGRMDVGAWVTLGPPDANAQPHLADFVAWGNDVVIVRGSVQSLSWTGTATTLYELAGSATWTDPATPGSTNVMPAADVVEQNHGYLFVAGTYEDGTHYPNRIRWSHPNNHLRWAEQDFIDLLDGGQKITALIGFSDRLMIFKPDSVWALFGYNSDTWELTNVSRTVGAWSQQVICRNENAVFFLSWPQGIFVYTERGGVIELSVSIRTIFEDRKLDADSIDNSWLGWMGRRLWCSLPYFDTPPPPPDARTVFVFDPALSDPGSWMMFRGATYCVPGPYMERADADQNTPILAFNRHYPYIIQLEIGSLTAEDECEPGIPKPFDTRMRTRWVDAGAPTWRKSWRRADFLLRGLTFQTTVNAQVFHDFNSYDAERSFELAYTPTNPPAKYTASGLPAEGGFLWGDGTKYGGSNQTVSVERGGTMGRSGTVQLLCIGVPGVIWGLNGIILKYVPRRFR